MQATRSRILPRRRKWLSAQTGLTVMEILVGISIMAIVAGSISLLVGTAVQSKMITASRQGDTETARESLDWMSERLRNAGLNVQPGTQAQTRCKDRVVAQDVLLVPTATSVYVTGDLVNTTTTPPYPIVTIGYYVAADPVTGTQVIMEYDQACSSGATSVAANSNPLSMPNITVTGLTFQYYDSGGNHLTNPSTLAQIRSIQLIQISLSVQTTQGRSGVQAQTLTRNVVLRNPDPNTANWMDPNETY
jgi:hypothetical protein